jgi:hypothetical protein
LQFLLPNVYGPDISANPGTLEALTAALDDMKGGIAVGLFDDSWAWGQSYFGPMWQTAPNLSDTNNAAQTLYSAKWQPFFKRIPGKYWYSVDGRPLIYFYNAGTLKPLTVAAAVIARMKQLFQADFSVAPFVVVDGAYFADPLMSSVADGRFDWDTFTLASGLSSYVMNGVTVDHFMPRWDSLGRDKPGQIASASDRLVKGPQRLSQQLAASANAQLTTIATWNDLGEGTGVTYNYDYYYQGNWLAPSYFMDLIRANQCR